MFSKGNSTKSNLIFNFAGRIVIALTGILFVPVYLHFLGIEVYGVIGFFLGLQAILSLLDLGISPTLTREIARLSAFPDKAQEMRDLSRTLEILCWSVAGAMSLILLAASPLIARYWLRPERLSTETVTQALMLMSISFAFQWTSNFYSGGLIGLQQQKLYNFINSGGVVFRSAGAVVVLAFISNSVQAFLIWQMAATLSLLLTMAIAYWRSLPLAEPRSRFRRDLLASVWVYAAGMTGISLVALILTQTDKIILSRLLSLENFGYYTLATTLAGTAIGTISGSIGVVFFPQFSQLVALGDDGRLRSIYHRSAQVMSVFLIPVMIVTAFFSYEILLLWTRNEKIAENTWLVLSLLAVGTGLNGLMQLPYFMQLANGLTKLAFWLNVGAIILLIPFMIFATIRYGAVGGALTWFILNLIYVLVGMQIMHRLLLKGELWKWYLEDVGLPLTATLLGVLTIKLLIFHIDSPLGNFAALCAISWVALSLAILATAQIRRFLFEWLGILFRRVSYHKE